MTTNNRATLLNKIHKVLKKHYKPIVVPAERTVIEHLLYACCLENARYEAADEAFAKLKEMYFDWNEVRVTTITELAEIISGIPDASGAAQRIKRVLQSIFETTYSFDIEALRKQNLGKSEKDLEKIQGTSPFTLAFVAQNALGGHSIPISKGAVEVLYAVGAVSDIEADKLQVPGLERAIPKNKGVEFGSLLQQIGADYFASPGSSKLRAILAEMDGDYKERIGKRAARVEEAAKVAAAAATERRAVARAQAAAEQKAHAPAKDSPAGAKGQAKDAAKNSGKTAPGKSSGKSAAKGPEKPSVPAPPVKGAPAPAKPVTPAKAPTPAVEPVKAKSSEKEKEKDHGKAKPPVGKEAAKDHGKGKPVEKAPPPPPPKKKEEPPAKPVAKKPAPKPPTNSKGLTKKKPR